MAKRMLHADNDEHMLRMMNRVLWRWLDASVDQVTTAQELIERARNGGYDLIITDCEMGPSDKGAGLSAIRSIREFDQATPIVLFTAKSGLDAIAREAGANEVISKMFDFATIEAKVRRYLL